MSSPAPLFGTDGVRGVFGAPPLDEPTVVELGLRLGELLTEREAQPVVLIGGDTRGSTPTIVEWLARGLVAARAVPRALGVLPTPGIAWVTASSPVAAGIAVSASHNPAADNGIKLIAPDGFKWEAEAEHRLAARLTGARLALPAAPPALPPDQVGRSYCEHLRQLVAPGAALAGVRLAIDAAHGAASALVEELFTSAGAEVELLNTRPDGRNINLSCGSTHPEELCRRVAAGGFDLGLALDGDADRVVVVDERGELRDGDAILYLWATALAARQELDGRGIVATSMSNLGLEHALRRHGIGVVRCDVGDRAVVETLRREGLKLGGEQSGHIVHLGLSTTGDGLLTGLAIATLVAAAGQPLSALLADFHRFPQLLRNVRVARRRPFAELPRVAAAVREVEARLAGEGRLVLRYSGTEPLARIMIEGPDENLVAALAEELATAIATDLG